MIAYRHTQFGTVNVVIIIAILPLVILPAWLAGAAPLAWMILIFLLGVLVLFHNLTVTINGQDLRISFGIGLIRKRFPLDQIASCQPVRNSWLYGWGIRLTPRGWLYNVSGLEAVELKMKSGKTCRIGTDEPGVLAAALEEALSRMDSSSEATE